MSYESLRSTIEAQAVVNGDKCAAWLVRKHKRQFRTRGVVEFRIYRGKLQEGWARKRAVFVAIEHLRLQRWWHVTVETKGIQLCFRVYYLRNELGCLGAKIDQLD